jgi:hypothetical protein
MKEFLANREFAKWCFGDVWDEYMQFICDGIDLMNSWNELHGDLLYMDGSAAMFEKREEMQKLWREYNDNKQNESSDKANSSEAVRSFHPTSSENDGIGLSESTKTNSRIEITNGQEDAHGLTSNEEGRKGHKSKQAKSSKKSAKVSGKEKRKTGEDR